MYDNFKLYNYSKSLVSPEGYGRHESNFLSGDIINGFETVIGTGLQVTTKPGNAVIRSGTGGTASAHLVSLTADFTVTLATADASNPRIDAIVLYVDTSVSLPSGTPTAANLDGLGVAKLVKVNGTPASSPSAPSTAAIQSAIGSASYPYTILANWRVNAGVSALAQTNCTDTRVFAAPKNERALGQSSFIESGGVASYTGGTLNGSITAGTAWISVGGVLVPQAFNSLNFTMAASKDRYYYVTLGNSTIQAATDATNGGVVPTLPANSVWLAKIISNASAITTVDQYSLTSSGARIYPNNPDIGGQQAWQSLALQNSWANFGAPYANAAYMKDSLGFVHLKGLVKSGASGSTIFTLPAGYRPSETHYIPGLSNDAVSSMTIAADGTVKAFGGSVSAWTTLSQITFRAES